jgi:hypothetical protein
MPFKRIGQIQSARKITVLLLCLFFLLAAACVLLTQQMNLASVLDAFWSETWQRQLAWMVIGLVPLLLLLPVLLLLSLLLRRGDPVNDLALQLEPVDAREGAEEPTNLNAAAEVAVHRPARNEWEGAVSAMQKQLLCRLQQNRDEMNDLRSRIDAMRAQQGALKERLAPVVKTTPPIEQILGNLERILIKAAGDGEVGALKDRLQKLVDCVGRCQEQWDDIEHVSKTIAGLKDDYFGLRSRLAPYAKAVEGVARGIKGVREASDMLAADMDSLMPKLQGNSAASVQNIADGKKRLDAGIGPLSSRFDKLATLRRDIEVTIAPYTGTNSTQAVFKAPARPVLVK